MRTWNVYAIADTGPPALVWSGLAEDGLRARREAQSAGLVTPGQMTMSRLAEYDPNTPKEKS